MSTRWRHRSAPALRARRCRWPRRRWTARPRRSTPPPLRHHRGRCRPRRPRDRRGPARCWCRPRRRRRGRAGRCRAC
ncbi:MAG: hypothetical protein D6798_12855 [Deltaproteobacteria bacterium]|nr:MAG: hypothetical protein D6798_12855 [Deltaproteobacteria bacterium]